MTSTRSSLVRRSPASTRSAAERIADRGAALWRRALPLAVLMLTAIAMSGCEDDPLEPNDDPPYTVHKMDFVVWDTILQVGDSTQAYALGIDTLIRGVAEYADMTVADTAIAVAAIDQRWYGYQDRFVIIGRAPGRTYIIASAGDLKDSVPLRVIFPLETIQIAPPGPFTLTVGDSAAVTATPIDTSGASLPWLRPYWITYNSSVATIAQNGMIHARGPGVTTITANAFGVEGRVTVTVSASTASH